MLCGVKTHPVRSLPATIFNHGIAVFTTVSTKIRWLFNIATGLASRVIMDHLPSFGASAPIEVPCICTEMYDGGSFANYLERKGWDRRTLYREELEARSPEETTSILQAWMYSGLLYQVFQPVSAAFDPDDFIFLGNGGKRKITTEKLLDYVLKWYLSESESPIEQRQAWFEELDKCFKELLPFVLRYCCLESPSYLGFQHSGH
jgi:hypothetical protein